jgi:hypothetical protein
MIYKADINEIPLSVFIEVYTNENHGVSFDIPTDEAVSKIVGDYMAIVGGKQIASEVVNANRKINLALMVECMTACENLILLNNWKGVCEVLLKLGYSLKESDHERIKQRVQTLKSKAEYDLSKEKEADKPKEKPTKEMFTKERVTIMKYNKMQIDTKTITAGEYAWLVRQTCDEIEELNRKHKK